MLVRIWKNGNLYTLLEGMQISITTLESSMGYLKKLKTDLPYDPMIPLLGIYPKECKTGNNRDTCTLMIIAALFTIAKL
jgi:hypothetical protein